MIWLALFFAALLEAVFYRVRGGVLGLPRWVTILIMIMMPSAVTFSIVIGMSGMSMALVCAMTAVAASLSVGAFSLGHGNAMRLGRLDNAMPNGGYSLEKEIPFDLIFGLADATKPFGARWMRDALALGLGGLLYHLPFSLLIFFTVGALWPAIALTAFGLLKVVAYEFGWRFGPFGLPFVNGQTEMGEALTGAFLGIACVVAVMLIGV